MSKIWQDFLITTDWKHQKVTSLLRLETCCYKEGRAGESRGGPVKNFYAGKLGHMQKFDSC